MLAMAERLYPICRSVTGPGVQQTLRELTSIAPLTVVSTPSGTPVFDWQVPAEWHIHDAYVEAENGERLIDFTDHNLHVLNFSEAIDGWVTHEELMRHLFTRADRPDWIPYRTSYYQKDWGFCTRHADLRRFSSDRYRVKIDAEHRQGALHYGELLLPGRSRQEVLFYTHICHPSLANDNLSGMVVLAHLAQQLADMDRRYSYRFVWGPGTIGSITWLANNQSALGAITHGLVTVLLGRAGPFTYKRSRDGDSEIDRVCEHLLDEQDHVVGFDPYGYDERQFGSPGIKLPVGRLSRAPHGEYPEYHTSADDLSLIDAQSLEGGLVRLLEIVDVIENNRRFVNLSPMCEPQLGKRGLYRPLGGEALPQRENAMLWVLNQSDGNHHLLEIAERSAVPFSIISAVADELVQAGLLKTAEDRGES